MRWLITAVLVVAAVVADAGAQGEAGTLAAELRAAAEDGADWRQAFALGQRAAESEDGLEALRAAWPDIESARFKQQLVKAWHFDLPTPFRVRLHPDTVAFLTMVLEAGEPEVSEWVMNYLPTYAWLRFADEVAALAWLTHVKGRDAESVLVESQRQWAEAWRASDAAEPDRRDRLESVLVEIGHPHRRNAALSEAAERDGVAEVLASVVSDERADATVRRAAFNALRSVPPR